MHSPKPISPPHEKHRKPRYITGATLAILSTDGTLLYKSSVSSDFFEHPRINECFLDEETISAVKSEGREYGSFVFKDNKAYYAIPCGIGDRCRIFVYPLSDAVFNVLDRAPCVSVAVVSAGFVASMDRAAVSFPLYEECIRICSAHKQLSDPVHPISESIPYPAVSLLDVWLKEYLKEAPIVQGCSIKMDISDAEAKTVRTSPEHFSAMMTAVCDHLMLSGAEEIKITAKKKNSGISITLSADTKTEDAFMGSISSFDGILTGFGSASLQTIAAFAAAVGARCTLEYSRDAFSRESFTADFRLIDVGMLGFKAAVPFDKVRVGVRSVRLVCGI